jgi:hypothetical protein
MAAICKTTGLFAGLAGRPLSVRAALAGEHERRPGDGMRIVGILRMVDHGQNGAAQGFRPADRWIGLDRGDEAGGQLNRGIGLNFPMRNQQRTRAA